MTVEEIKSQKTMFDILPQYNIRPNRSMMVSCPFHKDRHPSMKIYKDGFKCFTCGKYGDIFGFVQEMEKCSFKDAYLLLGGEYAKDKKPRQIMNRKKFNRQTVAKNIAEHEQRAFKHELLKAIKTLETTARLAKPYSDTWVYANNKLPFLMGAWEEKYIYGREIDDFEVYRICRQVRQNGNLIG